MEPLPMRMRRRIVELYDAGELTGEIAEALGTSKSGTRRIRQRLRERGTLQPLVKKPGPASGLSEQRAAELRTLVAAEPGLTREQLRERLKLSVDVRTLGRWLKRLGLVLKKSRSVPVSRTGPTWPSDAPPGHSC